MSDRTCRLCIIITNKCIPLIIPGVSCFCCILTSSLLSVSCLYTSTESISNRRTCTWTCCVRFSYTICSTDSHIVWFSITILSICFESDNSSNCGWTCGATCRRFYWLVTIHKLRRCISNSNLSRYIYCCICSCFESLN